MQAALRLSDALYPTFDYKQVYRKTSISLWGIRFQVRCAILYT